MEPGPGIQQALFSDLGANMTLSIAFVQEGLRHLAAGYETRCQVPQVMPRISPEAVLIPLFVRRLSADLAGSHASLSRSREIFRKKTVKAKDASGRMRYNRKGATSKAVRERQEVGHETEQNISPGESTLVSAKRA